MTQSADCIDYLLTREGGHTHHCVIHVEDATRQAIVSTLSTKVNFHPNIRICRPRHWRGM